MNEFYVIEPLGLFRNAESVDFVGPFEFVTVSSSVNPVNKFT